jgi:DNA polymerase III epsilon subunit-like protein
MAPEWNDKVFTEYGNHGAMHLHLPPLMVAFDTETTDRYPETAEPVSYALAVYHNGIFNHAHHIIANANQESDPGALAIHGWSRDKLSRSAGGERFPVTLPPGIAADHPELTSTPPAISPQAALGKAARILGEYQKRGAVIVGANHVGYDVSLLNHLYPRLNGGAPLESSGFIPSRARFADVLENDRQMDEALGMDRKQRSHSLTNVASRLGVVNPNAHDALSDAITSADVYVKQILENNRRMRAGEAFYPQIANKFGLDTESLGTTGSIIGELTGIDHKQNSFCTMKPDCSTCNRLSKQIAAHSEGGNPDKDAIEGTKNLLKMHKELAKQVSKGK